MPSTPRQIVRQCLRFESPERMPRQTWVLPWAAQRYPEVMAHLAERYPDDIIGAPGHYNPSPRAQGDFYVEGTATDEWGCVFTSIQAGVIGEVRDPLLEELDAEACKPPYEILPTELPAWRAKVDAFVAETDRFVLAGCCPRPWERYQFLRGSANAMLDVAGDPAGFERLLQKIHAFYVRELELWASTRVDALMFMDDWGSQNSLLISPAAWRKHFKPLYREYCEIAHRNGKFIFMHSDGCIDSIYEDLAEVGVDAVNSQLFVMDMAGLAKRVKGRITFWGEIDRQHILPEADEARVRGAVREVAQHLYDQRGGIIAQFEFGPGAHPANPMLIYDEWDRIQQAVRGAAEPVTGAGHPG